MLYLAIRHFRYFLEGHTFTAFKDHKLLTFALANIAGPWSARQQRHLPYVSEFTTDVRHVAGKLNVVADAFSRPAIPSVLALDHDIDYCELAAAQRVYTGMSAHRTTSTVLQLAEVLCGAASTVVLCDVSTGHARPHIPVSLRRRVFDAIHGLAHPSIRATPAILVRLPRAPQARSCLGPRLYPVPDHQDPAARTVIVA